MRLVLRSGEVIALTAPFAIAEVEAGQFRVADTHTPARTVPITEVTRVEEARWDATSSVAVAAVITLGVLTAILVVFGGNESRSTLD